MRILVGYTNQIAEIRRRLPLPGRHGDEIVAFGNGYTRVQVRPEMSWADILARCPSGWRPDVYIHWSPEYNPVPQGLEEAECLTVGVFGDWNLGGRAMRAIGGIFDILVADRGGCERLQNMGFPNVLHSLLWAYDPQKHRRLELEGAGAPERDIDVLMIGNFNSSVQWERAPWLARVARLSRHHRVVLTSGLFDEAYLRTMNQAKIVFNRSIRGEANMRAYEAAACGALLFYEAGNREIQEIYEDRESCVLYDETNLEALLAFYLDPQNSAERLRIAENGWQRVQQHSYAHHFADLLNHIEQLLPTCIGTRPLCLANPVERDIAVANHWLMSCKAEILPLTDILLHRTKSRLQKDSQKDRQKDRQDDRNGHSAQEQPVIEARITMIQCAIWGKIANGASHASGRYQALQVALAHAHQTLKLVPQSIIARFNLAYLTLAMDNAMEAEAQLLGLARDLNQWESTEATDVAECAGMWCLYEPFLLRRFAWFDVAIERIYGDEVPGSVRWQQRMCAVLIARVHITLGDLAFSSQRYPLALKYAARAVQAMPELGEAHYAHAIALHALGRIEIAIVAYQQTIRIAAFHMPAYEELGRLYLDSDRIGEAKMHLESWIALLDGSPLHSNLRPTAEKLLWQAQRSTAAPGSRWAEKSPVPVYCLLALPDWNNQEEWQRLVRAFALRYCSSKPVMLMLRADPNLFPDAFVLLERLESYLRFQLGCSGSTMPNITLLNQALVPNDCWKLIHTADALIATENLPAFWCDLAEANAVPILHEVPEDIECQFSMDSIVVRYSETTRIASA